MACLSLASLAPLAGQDKTPPPPPQQPAPEKIEKNEPPAVPLKYERDGTTMLVHYFLAAVATILVLLLICMPIRRD